MTIIGAAIFRYGHVEEALPAEPSFEVQVAQEPPPPACEAYAAMWFERPADIWVIGSDPLGTGRPMMTLTTCEPRFSAAKRLIVFAEIQF